MYKKFWDDIILKGYTWSEKLRIYWVLLSFMSLCTVDEAPFWLLALLLGNFAAAAISIGKIEFKDEEEES
jgi:hypothetical protein